MLAASHRFAHAMIALEAGVTPEARLHPRPEFKIFENAVEKTLELLAAKFRGKRVGEREFPDLRAAYTKLAQAGDPQLARYGLVNVEAHRMTNSLNTLHDQLFNWRRDLPTESPSAGN
jgi:hypothetical protein